MNEIKNLHLLAEKVKPGDIDKMEIAALQHRRHNSIRFKIVEIGKGKVTIQIAQGKNAWGNYFPSKRLVEIVHETYDRFFPGMKVVVHPIPYVESPANKVDVEWVNRHMIEAQVKLKDIAQETGIAYTQLSELITGARPLSQPMKALFYFYFCTKGEI